MNTKLFEYTPIPQSELYLRRAAVAEHNDTRNRFIRLLAVSGLVAGLVVGIMKSSGDQVADNNAAVRYAVEHQLNQSPIPPEISVPQQEIVEQP